MNNNPTEAERALADLFEARKAGFAGTPLDAARESAFSRFAANGLPHRRVEAYKYTDLRARLRELPGAAGAPDAAKLAAVLADNPPLVEGAARIVIANGRYVPEHSSTMANVTVASLLDPAADTTRVGKLVAESDDPLTLANVGLFEGGVVINVTGEAGAPLEIVHVSLDDGLVMGRTAVIVAPEARVSVVERAIGTAGTVANDLTELTVGARAKASWIRIEAGVGDKTVQLGTLHTEIDEEGALEHLTVSTGAGLSRNQIFASIVGDEADAHFRAATVAIGKRHVDNTMVVRHDALNSRSSEVLRSAVGHGGTAIVQGRIIVDPGAQKTDARMMSNALFLDDSGEVVNKPELEIFADDVQCGHGATSGDIDEEMVFYLRARGIPQATARRLLVEAFLVEALDRVEDEALREGLADSLRAALDLEGAL
ncbi:SufD family Fe-S cluster assembly protein [Acuticoccus sp. M5D2P5]|uniref:SufB/SufD family protein n=1 Tax=Acuticoccus kalidii TaxID=2910977 RepID=UPI001F3B3957|nr:SufD family Fe-S cluster assembly protein [Acuticoccus kalidii]MCF3932529.1 SufD family Fe-S cluster assembly protein [Acuticoccus kalidii]